MKRLSLILVLVLPVLTAGAQTGDIFLSGAEGGQVSASVVYQRIEDDERPLNQVSFPVYLTVAVGPRLNLSALASGALAGGDGLEGLYGPADAQLGLSYRQAVGRGSVVANLGVSLPSGKRELTQEEFATSILLSQSMYDFHLPTLGQGLGVSPSVIVAYPVSETVAVGAGIGYQRKGPFQPLSIQDTMYDPGDELVLTGGVDVRLGPATALSGDLVLTRYGTDRLDEEDYYEAGNRIMATVQFLRYQGYNELRLLARYSSRARGTLPAADGAFVTEEQRLLPDQGRLRLTYRRRTTPAMYLGLLVQGRLYGETAAYAPKQLLDLGALPEVRISDNARLITRFIYTVGSFSGLEVGGGVAVDW